jgi:hypothetical protein
MHVTVLAGFGPTYYFSTVSGSTLEITPALRVRDTAFTTWMLLLVVQSTLISTRRVDVPRQLGGVGAVLGTCVV